VQDGAAGGLPSPVAVVISTRIKPGQEAAYRRWEQRMAVAQTRAPGFQGYRFEPPIPGVQEDYLSILRFDTEEHLKTWMESPERARLLEDAKDFTEEFHTRTVRTGFDQWFSRGAAGALPPAAWKMNMIVLLLLYPVVFLFGVWVMIPHMLPRMPFPVALFLSNVVSIILLNYLVPWTSKGFGWWLADNLPSRRNVAGAALLLVLYGLLVSIFWYYFT
jgi:antibiotic biosynthesis monooxygenase (ABM) superfamily enzyme